MAKDQIDRAEGVAAGDVAAVSKKQEVAVLLKKMKVEEEGASQVGEADQSASAFDAATSEQEVAAAQGAFAADGSYEVAQAGAAAGSAAPAAAGGSSAAAGGMSTGTMLALGGVALAAGGVAIASSGGGGGGGDGSPKPYGTKFALTVSPTSVSEGAVGTKEMTFSLVLDEAPKQAITISYSTLTSGSATTGSDFVGESGTVTFAAGQAAASITITVNGDVTVEGDETIQVLFSSSNLDASVTGTGTITNDDVAVPGGVSELFTLKEVVIPGVEGTPPETRIYWGYTPFPHVGPNDGNDVSRGIPVEDLISFLKTITGLDLFELGLIDDDGVGPFDNVTNLTISNALSLAADGGSQNANDDSDIENDTTLRIDFDDGTFANFNIEAQIAEQYFSFLNSLLLDDEGNSRLFEVAVPGTGTDDTYDQIVPIRLTPQENNGGTLELGSPLTTGANSLIIAGRVELLHQAYIDAGAGNNVLEIDAKGTYAQPTALLNIQEIRVNDLPNFYTTSYGSGDGNLENTEVTSDGFPSPTGNGSDNTWIDLNRALQLTKLVVTDQGTDSESDFEYDDLDGYSGDLTIVGVRNAATLRLEGGFNSGSTTIQYGFGQTGTLNVELAVGTVNEDINILQNASVLSIDSQGVENNLNEFFMGGDISRLIVTGDASFSVQGNIGPSFNSNRPAVIDASDNTGGVDLNVLSGVREVRFLSSQGEDDVNFLLPDSSLGITKITVTGQDGDGHYDLDANVVNVVLGNGDNVVHTGELFGDSPGDRTMDIANITVGNGKNTIDAIAFVGGTSAPNPSPEANVNEDTQSKIVITAGSGGNDINAWGDFVTVNTGTGNDEINATGRDIRISSNGGDDVVTIFGNNDDFQGSSNTLLISQEAIEAITDGVFLNINLGTGNNTLVLGGDVDSILQPIGSVTALAGSVITGSNITLVVNETSDLRAASLTGITRVVLDDDSANGDGGGANNAQLTLTAAQFTAIGPAAFNVEFATFGAAAQLKIIITQDTNLSALGDLSLLSPNIRLNFEIYNDATLTLTAEQLHTYVATDGITVFTGFNGNVVINNAGPNFDPFQDTVGGLSVGSLNETLGSSDDVTINRTPDGFERDLPDPNQDQLIITNAGPDVLMVGPIDLTGDQNAITEVILNGGGAFNFANAGPILLPENFVLDFSAAGAVTNLTIGNFENITADSDDEGTSRVDNKDDWGQIIGNGLPGQRINVQISDNVGDAADAVNGGFRSSGVEVYVATELTDPNEGVGEDEPGAQLYIATCVNTQDITTLGLQGNYEDTLTYENTERGIDFLMEVVYVKDQGYVVGTLVTDFARPGGTAVVNVVGLAALPEGEVQKVAGIDVTDAVSATINVDGGNTVIESFDAESSLVDLTLTADADLVMSDVLPADLASFDASGVVGELEVSVDLWSGEGENGPLEFIGAAGGTELTIDDAAEGAIASIDGAGAVNLTIGDDEGTDTADLTGTTLGNIGTVSLHENTELSVTLEQADAIGSANFVFLGDEGQTATLNLVGLNDQVFSVAQYPEEFIITLTLAEIPEVFINPLTDFTGIDSLEIPEGTTLYLSMEQFQQLGVDGMGPDDVVLTGEGSVVITGTTQASVGENGEDLDLTSIVLTGTDDDGNDISTVTVNLVEDVNLSEATMALANLTAGGAPDPAGVVGPSVDVFNIGGFTLTLGDINTADTTDVIGTAGSTLKFTDIDEVILSRIDAGGFDVDFLEVEAALVADNNVDFMFDNLIERVTKVIVDEFGQVVGRIQNVTIEATTTVPGDLSFNDYGLDSEVTTLNVTLGGGVLLDGDLIVSTKTPDPALIATYLEELNIISEGTEANTLNGATDNVITGDVTPLSPFPGYDPDGPGGELGEAADNNLKVVNITATQNLVIGDGDPLSSGVGGSIIFSSHGEDGVGENEPVDGVTANDDDEADVFLNVSGTADVTVEQLDISDEDVENLFIDNEGTGTLTVTGGTPAIVTGLGSEGVYVTGSGDIVLSDELATTPTTTTLESTSVSVFDASGHSGLLAAGEIQGVDNADFSFTSGSGVTTMKFTDNNLDSTGLDTIPGNADDTAGWTFDFSNAAVGSTFHFAPPAEAFVAGSKLTIDMGPNAVLYIDTNMNLSDLNLTILGGQSIVLADGAELTLSAEQADGLTIIAGPDTDADPDTNGVVNIVNLNENPVDLSGIAEEVAGFATLQLDDPLVSPVAADVTLDVATDLGFFDIHLTAISDADDLLSGQTIRFTTVEQAGGDNQAGREVVVVGNPTNSVNSTNVVWLFENLDGAPINTSGYFEPGAVIDGGYQIGRLWLNDTLIANEGGNIEDLFTTLPPAIIRAEFSDASLLDALLSSQPVDRIFEVVSFLDLGDISFNDTGIDPDEHIESLTVKLGGQSNIDSITLDDEIAPNTDPDSVAFDTLRIESHRALSEDHFLASEFYDNDNDGIIVLGEDVLPDNVNTIGDIGTGSGLELTAVEIDTLLDTTNAPGVDPEDEDSGSFVGTGPGATLVTGTITYDSNDPGTIVTLLVDGENDVTIASVDTTDTDIVGILTTNNLAGGATLIAPGASPAFNLDNTEGWALAGSGDMEAGSATNAGVVGNELSEIDASASTGDLDFGVVADIDGSADLAEDFDGDGNETDPYEGANEAFEFTAGTGVTTMTLGTANGRTPTLEAGNTWTFTYTGSAAGSSLTITDDVIFQPSPALPADPTLLVLNDVPLIIEGAVDFTQITLDFNGLTAVSVPAGNTLVLTIDQVAQLLTDGIEITGSGTVAIEGEVDTDAAVPLNLSGIQTVNIDLSAITNDGGSPQLNPIAITLNALGAIPDDWAIVGDEVGFDVVGTDFNDAIIGSAEDDTFTMGAGDDSLTGGDGSDTFNVDADVDTITDLVGEDPLVVPVGTEQDVLVVSATAEALADTTGFIATSGTVNNGTATITAVGGGDVTIDVSAAGGANGFTLVGGLGTDTLIGSEQDDTINGGPGSALGEQDVLTGNGGEDSFVFEIQQSAPIALTQNTTTDGEDLELWQFDITGAGFAADNGPGAGLNVSFRNGDTTSNFTINDDLIIDFTDGDALGARVATELSARGLATVYTPSPTASLSVTGTAGQSVEILAFTPVLGAWAGTSPTELLVGAGSDADDVAQVTDVTVGDGGITTATAGETYSISFEIEGSVYNFDYTAIGGETEAQIATALSNGIEGQDPGAEWTVAAVANVITVTDDVEDNGGLIIALDNNPGISGTGASALGAGAGVWADADADVITDFTTGEDSIQLFAAGTNANYLEAAEVADYATAFADAAAEMNGTIRYYLTSATDLDGAGLGTDGAGLLFFDANGDSDIDGVIALIGVTQGNFDETDIIAYV